MLFLFFFFNDPATTEIYTLSLHELFRSTGDTVLVEFMAHAGIAYRLQARDDLAKGNWSTVGRLEPRPTSGLVRLPEFLPGSQQTRYYRIEVREP